MVLRHFRGTLSAFCGGIDNLYRHHDYSLALLEAIRPYPMSRFWLHGAHLFVNGQKMSKSKGNILYTDMLIRKGYSSQDIRFFLMYSHYRKKLNYSDKAMETAAGRLRDFRERVKLIRKKAGSARPAESEVSDSLGTAFVTAMDNDMSVKPAFDAMQETLKKIEVSSLSGPHAAGIIRTLKKIDEVLQIIF
jgi:cysteinyl-tRNA synthetase